MTARPLDRSVLIAVLARHSDEPGALLPLLHDVQHAFGHIPGEFVETIASHQHLSRAEVHGVITYYSHFRSAPAGRVVIQMCRAEACQARGAAALIEYAEAKLGCAMSATRSDGAITLEPVYCLGQCAIGPNIQIGERLHGRVSRDRFDTLVAPLGLQAGAAA